VLFPAAGTAAALMDLSFLADDVHKIISHQPLVGQRTFSDQCVKNVAEIYSILGSGGIDFMSVVWYFIGTKKIPENDVQNMQKFMDTVAACITNH